MLTSLPARILLVILLFMLIGGLLFIVFWGAMSSKRDNDGAPDPTPDPSFDKEND